MRLSTIEGDVDFPCEHIAWTKAEIVEAVDSPDARERRRQYWLDLDRRDDVPPGTHRDDWRRFLTRLRDGEVR